MKFREITRTIGLIFFFSIPAIGMSQLVGADADKYGCRSSAGETYSILKKECIQLFNAELTLQSTDGSKMTALLFSKNKKKAEVFLPDQVKPNLILKRKSKNGKSTWVKSGFLLEQTDSAYELKKDGKLIYKTENK